jgi:twitching motility two-component system response regulator PilH
MAKILIADDSPTARAFMAKVVRECGHEPIEAADGAEAVALAKQSKPALVLLDVVMGANDGFRACRQIKKDPATRHIPIAIVTCKGAASDEMWGRKMGADEYLRKPLTEETLIETVRRFV